MPNGETMIIQPRTKTLCVTIREYRKYRDENERIFRTKFLAIGYDFASSVKERVKIHSNKYFQFRLILPNKFSSLAGNPLSSTAIDSKGATSLNNEPIGQPVV